MSRASFNKKGPRSGLSSEASSMTGFSGDFFFPEVRSGEGLAREVEVEGEGDGGRRGGAGEVVLDWDRSGVGRICELVSSGTVIRRGGASGGVLTDTKPGILAPNH